MTNGKLVLSSQKTHHFLRINYNPFWKWKVGKGILGAVQGLGPIPGTCY